MNQTILTEMSSILESQTNNPESKVEGFELVITENDKNGKKKEFHQEWVLDFNSLVEDGGDKSSSDNPETDKKISLNDVRLN